MNNSTRISIVIITASLVVCLVILAHKEVPVPLFIINTTPSVPLGLYKHTSFIPQDTQKVYVALNPELLLQRFPALSRTQQSTLYQHGIFMISHNKLLIKELSKRDYDYLLMHGTLPPYIHVMATHYRGIDSDDIGRVSTEYLQGLYIHIGR